MSLLPDHIKERIILDAMLIKKNDIGWKDIHLEIKNPLTYLNKTNYIFDFAFQFEHAIRLRFVPYWLNYYY